MLRDEVVKIINLRLGNRKMDAVILAEMDFIQRSVLERRAWLPWFLETELASASTQAGERRVALPPDFLMEIEEESLWIETADGGLIELEKTDYDRAMRALPGDGQPVAYALASGYFQFFPKPDAAYKLQMRYYAQGESIAQANVEVSWLLHAADLVVAEVGLVIAERHLQNAALAASFRDAAAQALKTLQDRHVAMQEVNRNRLVGGE